MANTYSQIYIQIVFAVQGRQSLIQADHKVEIQKYIAGIIRKQNQKLIAIGGMPDHLHALIGMNPGIALSDLVPTSSPTRRSSLTARGGSMENSIGRKVSGLSHVGGPS